MRTRHRAVCKSLPKNNVEKLATRCMCSELMLTTIRTLLGVSEVLYVGNRKWRKGCVSDNNLQKKKKKIKPNRINKVKQGSGQQHERLKLCPP